MPTRLYSTTYCPYAWAVRIVLHEKRIPFEVFEVDLKHKQEEFLRLSPTAKVPLLVDGSAKICESMVINEYLEEKIPEPNLLGRSPEDRAAVRTAVIDINWNRSQPLAKLAAMLFYERERREDVRVQRHVRAWYAYLDELDAWFGTYDWLVLERMSFADVHLYATVSVSQGFGMRIGERRSLQAWLDRMNNRDSVQRSAPEALMPVA
jgi:RNA polymerase-associated protein